jgi:hypothetical protein
MRLFKQQLLDLLRDHGWELVSRDGDTDWWVEEHWLVRSVRENWGAELVLSFLVDPHYNGPKKSRAIWMIGATTEMPQDRLEAERGIALIWADYGNPPPQELTVRQALLLPHHGSRMGSCDDPHVRLSPEGRKILIRKAVLIDNIDLSLLP